MKRIDILSTQELKGRLAIALSDLSYAAGYAEGVGHSSVYINEQYMALLELFTDEIEEGYNDERPTT